MGEEGSELTCNHEYGSDGLILRGPSMDSFVRLVSSDRRSIDTSTRSGTPSAAELKISYTYKAPYDSMVKTCLDTGVNASVALGSLVTIRVTFESPLERRGATGNGTAMSESVVFSYRHLFEPGYESEKIRKIEVFTSDEDFEQRKNGRLPG
jgi:hypothetical protein